MFWLQLFASAACYLLYHTAFFFCVRTVTGTGRSRWHLLWTYLLNFGVFFVCSILKLHLILNWIVFLLLFFGELALVYRTPVRRAFLFALLGTQLGLAANILFRSMTALILNVPLIAFDNNVGTDGNLKGYPVLLGFFTVGVLFLLAARFRFLRNLNLVLEDRGALTFLTGLLTAFYLYLCLNLTVYYIEDNNLILKLWSMKSSLFVLTGEGLSVALSIRMGRISAYRREKREAQELLARERVREMQLRTLAATDPLTGCENRLQAKRRLQEALESGTRFRLCFIDLDGLKAVNDGFGHEMGDFYLLSAAGVLGRFCGPEDRLFRYGGDEFLILFFDRSAEEAEALLRRAGKELEAEGRSGDIPFPMGFSYGFAGPEDGTEAFEIIRAADARMYRMKAPGGNGQTERETE